MGVEERLVEHQSAGVHGRNLATRACTGRGRSQLGHARPSMTQDVYMSRGQIHTEVADVLDKAVGINDE